jgi:LysR family transcriptional regulator, glycine cleavage system transcriptional activator
MPSARLPPQGVPDLPVHELLALEAVSRLGSVQAAAEALHVTASGISHRIASLERRIGSPLLQRHGRGVVLTEVAELYVATVRPGLAALSAATEALLEHEHGVIRVATAAAVGASWLLPCIRRYLQRQPRARFELLTVATPGELTPDRWDILIHYGTAPRRGALRSVLFTEKLIQVRAADKVRPGAGQASLRLTQLEVAGTRGGDAAAHAQLVFDDALAMLEAVAAGAGTAWSTETAARGHLASGRVVRTDAPSRPGGRYVIDLSEAGQLKPLAAACYRWLVEEAAAGAASEA